MLIELNFEGSATPKRLNKQINKSESLAMAMARMLNASTALHYDYSINPILNLTQSNAISKKYSNLH